MTFIVMFESDDSFIDGCFIDGPERYDLFIYLNTVNEKTIIIYYQKRDHFVAW